MCGGLGGESEGVSFDIRCTEVWHDLPWVVAALDEFDAVDNPHDSTDAGPTPSTTDKCVSWAPLTERYCDSKKRPEK
jgi:hypothetical protein